MVKLKRHLLHLLAVGALLAVCYGSYANTFHSSFHFDDDIFIVNNPHIHDLEHIRTIWHDDPSRLVTFLTFALNYHFGKLAPGGYHLFNFLVHFLNSLLVYGLIWLFFLTPQFPRYERLKVFLTALFAGGIFATHPLQTQAVTYIWQRSTSLAAFFYLLALLLYGISSLLWQRKATWRPGIFYFIGAIISGILAMLSKQNAFTLPFAFFLLEFCFFSPGKEFGKRPPWLFLGLLLLGLNPVLSFMLQDMELDIINSLGKKGHVLSHYLLTQINVLWTYLRLLFLPYRQNLDYDYPITQTLNIATFIKGCGLIALVGLPMKFYRRYPALCFGVWFFFLTLSIESIVPLEDVIMEHRLYLPMFGFVVVISNALFLEVLPKITSRISRAVNILPFVLILMLACQSYSRNRVWETEETLWTDVIGKSPHKVRGYNNLGTVYMGRGEYHRAYEYFYKALTIDLEDVKVNYNMGLVYYRLLDYHRAEKYFVHALEIDPTLIEAHYNLGGTYMNLGNRQRALFHLHWAKRAGYPVPDQLFEELSHPWLK